MTAGMNVAIPVIGSAVSAFGCSDSRRFGTDPIPPASSAERLTVAANNAGASAPSGSSAAILSDQFGYFDQGLWHKANNWTNGDPFYCGWRADHVSFEDGKMVLTLTDTPSSGRPYTSGEYRSNDFYGFGSLEASIKAARGDGLVTSMFFYTGPLDNNPWDEIDMEILGKDTTKMQTNYYTNGVGGKEVVIDLGFDAAEGFHSYRIQWEEDKIVWYVNNKEVHSEDGSKGALPSTPGRIMMNLWPGTGVDGWLKPFTYIGPVHAYYDWIKYTPADGSSAAVKPEQKPEITTQVVKETAISGTPLTELIGYAFNGASGGKTGASEVKFKGSSYDDGMVLFEGNELSGDLVFSCEGTGPLKVLFIDSGGNNIDYEVIDADPAGKTERIEIPKGTAKITIMANGRPVDVKLSGFATE
jgi:endo-1,3-1,4-beta-glycanase ExoK